MFCCVGSQLLYLNKFVYILQLETTLMIKSSERSRQNLVRSLLSTTSLICSLKQVAKLEKMCKRLAVELLHLYSSWNLKEGKGSYFHTLTKHFGLHVHVYVYLFANLQM